MVARTSADVAFEGVAYFFFRWFGISFQKIGSGHNHARSAEAALQAMHFFEAFLQWMQRSVCCHTFDGGDFTTIGLHGQHGAAFYGLAIYMNGARATTGGVAAHMSAREAEHIAQVKNKEEAGLHIVRVVYTVDFYMDLHRRKVWFDCKKCFEVIKMV
jgi:hypothetical protein